VGLYPAISPPPANIPIAFLVSGGLLVEGRLALSFVEKKKLKFNSSFTPMVPSNTQTLPKHFFRYSILIALIIFQPSQRILPIKPDAIVSTPLPPPHYTVAMHSKVPTTSFEIQLEGDIIPNFLQTTQSVATITK
jgi:hypothetical protein